VTGRAHDSRRLRDVRSCADPNQYSSRESRQLWTACRCERLVRIDVRARLRPLGVNLDLGGGLLLSPIVSGELASAGVGHSLEIRAEQDVRRHVNAQE
jgi:hypothetical protein